MSRIFSFVWLGLTKVSQAATGRYLWIDPSKYSKKYLKDHVRQWAYVGPKNHTLKYLFFSPMLIKFLMQRLQFVLDMKS